jgi:IclR family acetate operon transcriptional repressor
MKTAAPPSASPPASFVKSAMRTLDIIEYVVSRGRPVVAQEIGAALTIPPSSLSNLLSTLVEREFLSREGRLYTPGDGLARLRANGPSLEEKAAPLVRSLRIQLNETTSFFLRRGWEVEAVLTDSSEHALRYAVQVGSLVPMHAFSAGKAILALLPEKDVTRYFAETKRARFTDKTVVSEKGVRAEIAAARKTGAAHTHEEYSPGIHGVGCAVRVGDDYGAFSVAIPNVRFNDEVEEKATALLKQAAAFLSKG